MKHISILLLETAIPAAIVDPRYMFTAVNEFYKAAGHSPYFNIQLVSVTPDVNLLEGAVTFKADSLLKNVSKTDLIIIPAISGNVKQSLDKNSIYLPWIIEQYKNGAEVASLCIGAFVLAATGLLNGKSCSTHWLHVNAFKEMFPQVRMADDRVITDQNGLFTSGGATSYWSLLLYLVEKYTTREMAIMAAKYFLLDIEKTSQLPFTIFRGQKEHGDDLILAMQQHIEQHYADKITIEELCDKFSIGRRTLERRFKKTTSNTIVEYIQRVKIESAKKQLESGRKTVAEVMFDIGYSDTKAFRDIFKRITGLSPIDYRNKYNPQQV